MLDCLFGNDDVTMSMKMTKKTMKMMRMKRTMKMRSKKAILDRLVYLSKIDLTFSLLSSLLAFVPIPL